MTADVAATIAANQREADRLALVAALHLPPETTWEEALARVVPVAAGAKGCHGCKFSDGVLCNNPAPNVTKWLGGAHLSRADWMTPKPGAPECPGRVER